MKELTSARLIHLKGALFLALTCIASAVLVARDPRVLTAARVAATVWSSARFYYYAFYVVERYVDPSFRFAGLGSLARYALATQRFRRPPSR